MDELRDLQQMASLARDRFNQYDGEDFVLPEIFKEQVTEINSNTITYNKYSAIIETRGNQHGILNIFMPNQWFYIASYFTDFYNEIQKYKQYALQVTTKERLKELNGGNLSDIELSTLHNLALDENSKNYLVKFITDYSWWGGAKTIDRGDFYVSPILANANLVNASQTFVAELCAFLANKQELVQAIISKEENNQLRAPRLLVKNNILKNFVLDTIIYLQENDGLNSFLQYISSNQNANISFKGESFSLTGMFLESTLEDIKERNTGHIRWFEEPLFNLGDRQVYLSTQWNGSGNYQLTLNDFKGLIKACYNDKYLIKVNSERAFELWGYTSNNTQLHPVSPFTISTIIEKIKSTGLIYSDSLVKRFAYALMTKPFVILSGLAGSGKTQLALAFAECLSEDVERQVRVVSVGADWTNREPLLGYPNALKSNEYVMPECGALDMLIEAHENPNKPYFLILDEMNLSVVERYFADFLSAMESKKPIALWKGSADGEGNMAVPNEIQLPKNLYIIGTINVDETTYMFSPKVLDIAHVIEFKIAAEEMASFLETNKKVERHACHSACAGMAEDFLKRTTTCAVGADTTSVQGALNGFFKILKSVNAEFGYRTANEIYRYINNVGDELGKHGALDTAILQKLLPKLHGSRKKLSPVLSALWQLCFLEGSSIAIESVKDFADVEGLIYPISAEKILRMYRAVVDNGFTSFAEA